MSIFELQIIALNRSISTEHFLFIRKSKRTILQFANTYTYNSNSYDTYDS